MDSAARIDSIRHSEGTYRPEKPISQSLVLITIRSWGRFLGFSYLRRLGIKALLLADVMLGLWLAGTYIYIFNALSHGGTVGEPDIVIARTELWLSIVITCWFLWQVPYWAIKLLRGSWIGTPTVTSVSNSEKVEG